MQEEERIVVLVVRGHNAVARWTVACDGRPGLAVVDDLARLQLAAKRLGCAVQLEGTCLHLRELLELAGLTDSVEVLGKTERGEEGGVDEAVVPDDPVA